MNRTYSIVWSAVRNMYVVASELARGHSKVKAQVCASETHSPNKKSEYGQIIKQRARRWLAPWLRRSDFQPAGYGRQSSVVC
ncbi:hypothetical protein JT306_00870 [Salmonella enterica subsp. enterica serovar Kentucky]|nr:hypothetical protein [Salmonella enterica subsp. enterica serovar Kentucky]